MKKGNIISLTGNIDIKGIKRCYVKGAIIKAICLKCKKEMSNDLGDDYLSYPVVGDWCTIYLYCAECDEEYELDVKIKSAQMVIECDPTKLKVV